MGILHSSVSVIVRATRRADMDMVDLAQESLRAASKKNRGYKSKAMVERSLKLDSNVLVLLPMEHKKMFPIKRRAASPSSCLT